MSNQIAIYTGYVNPNKANSKDNLVRKIEILEKRYKKFFNNLINEVAQKFQNCFNSIQESCEKVAKITNDSFEKFMLQLMDNLKSQKAQADFKNLNNGKITLNDQILNFSFGQPDFDKKEIKESKNKNYACNGVPLSFRKTDGDQVTFSLKNCMLKTITSLVSAATRGYINLPIPQAANVATFLKSIKGDDSPNAKEDMKEDMREDQNFAQELIEELNGRNSKNLLISSSSNLDKKGIIFKDNNFQISNKDKFLDFAIEKAYKYHKNNSLESDQLVKAIDPIDFNLPEQLRKIKKLVKDAIKKIEDALPSIFDGDCWSLKGLPDIACDFLGKFAGNLIYNGISTGGTGFVPPGVFRNLTTSTFETPTTGVTENIGIPFAIHSLARISAMSIVKKSENPITMFNNREYIFNKLEVGFNAANTSISLVKNLRSLTTTDSNISQTLSSASESFKKTVKIFQRAHYSTESGRDILQSIENSPQTREILQSTDFESFIDKTIFSVH